jgi:hypothetical protein
MGHRSVAFSILPRHSSPGIGSARPAPARPTEAGRKALRSILRPRRPSGGRRPAHVPSRGGVADRSRTGCGRRSPRSRGRDVAGAPQGIPVSRKGFSASAHGSRRARNRAARGGKQAQSAWIRPAKDPGCGTSSLASSADRRRARIGRRPLAPDPGGDSAIPLSLRHMTCSNLGGPGASLSAAETPAHGRRPPIGGRSALDRAPSLPCPSGHLSSGSMDRGGSPGGVLPKMDSA